MDFPLLLQRLKNDNYLIQIKNQRICEFDDNSQLIVSKKVLETSETISNMLAGALQRTRKIPFSKTSIEDFKIILPLMKLVAYHKAPNDNSILDFKSFCDNKDLDYLIEALRIDDYFYINNVKDNLIQIIAEKCDALKSQKEKKSALKGIKKNIKEEILFQNIFCKVTTLIPILKKISSLELPQEKTKKIEKSDLVVNPQKKYTLLREEKTEFMVGGNCRDTVINVVFSDINNNKEWKIKGIIGYIYNSCELFCLFNFDETRLVVCKPFGKYELIDTNTKATIATFKRTNDKHRVAFFNPDETLLVISTDTNSYEIRCARTGELKKKISYNRIDKIFFYNTNTLIVEEHRKYFGQPSTIHFIYINKNYTANTFEEISHFSSDRKNDRLLFYSNDNSVVIYDVKESHHKKVTLSKDFKLSHILSDSGDNKFLIIGHNSNNQKVEILKYDRDQNSFNFLFSENNIKSLFWSYCDKYIIYIHKELDEFIVKLFEINTLEKKNVANVTSPADTVNESFFVIKKKGFLYIPLDDDKTWVNQYDMVKHETKGPYKIHYYCGSGWCDEFSEDGKFFLDKITEITNLIHLETGLIIKSWKNKERVGWREENSIYVDIEDHSGQYQATEYYTLEYTLDDLEQEVPLIKYKKKLPIITKSFISDDLCYKFRDVVIILTLFTVSNIVLFPIIYFPFWLHHLIKNQK
jgi:hypothetical protein